MPGLWLIIREIRLVIIRRGQFLQPGRKMKNVEDDDYSKGVKHIPVLVQLNMGDNDLMVSLDQCPGGIVGICLDGSKRCRNFGGEIRKGTGCYVRCTYHWHPVGAIRAIDERDE